LRPPLPPFFPYTTLFRSKGEAVSAVLADETLCLRSLGGALPRPLGDRPQPEPQRASGEQARQDPERVLDPVVVPAIAGELQQRQDRKSTRLNSSHVAISY